MDEKQFFAVIIDVNLRRYSRLERYLKLVGISTPTSDRCEAVLGDTEAAQVFGVSSSDYTDAVKASGFTACDDQGLFKIIRKEAARRKYKNRPKLSLINCQINIIYPLVRVSRLRLETLKKYVKSIVIRDVSQFP